MRRMYRICVGRRLVAFAPVLAGCEEFRHGQVRLFHLNEKKKLPGERKEMFPRAYPVSPKGFRRNI